MFIFQGPCFPDVSGLTMEELEAKLFADMESEAPEEKRPRWEDD